MVNYEDYNAVKAMLEELRVFCFKYQPFGIVLGGFFEIPEMPRRYIDTLLLLHFQHVQFYAGCDECIPSTPLRKILTVSPTPSADVYKYSNSLADMIQLSEVVRARKPVLYQLNFINMTINNISYLELEQQSNVRHQLSRCFHTNGTIVMGAKIVSLNNQFEKFFTAQFKRNHYELLDDISTQYGSGLLVYRLCLQQIGRRYIIINLSDTKKIDLFKNEPVDPLQLVRLNVVTKYYLEPHDDIVYAHENKFNQAQVVSYEYSDCLYLSSELQACSVRADAQSIIVLDVVHGKRFEQTQSAGQQFAYVYYNMNNYNDDPQYQFSNLVKALRRFYNYIVFVNYIACVAAAGTRWLHVYNYAFHSPVGLYIMI